MTAQQRIRAVRDLLAVAQELAAGVRDEVRGARFEAHQLIAGLADADELANDLAVQLRELDRAA